MYNFQNTTHIIQNPAGTYSLVGSVPVDQATCHMNEATAADIMAGRAIRIDGKAYAPKFKTFPTPDEAWAAVEAAGATKRCDSPTCACRSTEEKAR